MPPLPRHAAIHTALTELGAGRDLDEPTSRAAFVAIMAGDVPTELIATLLLAIREKGEAATEIAGAVQALRATMQRIPHPAPDSLVDTCGTGGGVVSTINVSTAAAFLVAGAGIPVAKHGNRSFTSRSGSADVLEALGVAIDRSPEAALRQLITDDITFLFAPQYHPAMRHVLPARRQLGVATIMNLVGPLANPAQAGRQVVGVADRAKAPIVAEALRQLGTVHGLVVHAQIGMDEIAPVGSSEIWEIRDDSVREWRFTPAEHGLGSASLAGLEGGEPADNAARIEALLRAPASSADALRQAVELNAGAAIYVGGGATTLVAGVGIAREVLEQGRALDRLDRLRRAGQ
jgi:anthranilate phosphoribosyltransferase